VSQEWLVEHVPVWQKLLWQSSLVVQLAPVESIGWQVLLMQTKPAPQTAGIVPKKPQGWPSPGQGWQVPRDSPGLIAQ
jgi:hypothetical protein